jgi:hypothetical protein
LFFIVYPYTIGVQMTAEALRALLAVFLMGMFLLALVYLDQRKLNLREFLLWGLFALLIPALGPFLVIALSPGKNTTAKRNL